MATSIFEIVGPVMVGPSSSHTLGAVRLGSFARQFAGGNPAKVIVTLYGSFALTYKGHRTDIAIIGGLAGMRYDDENLVFAREAAKGAGLAYTLEADTSQDHPGSSGNVARFRLTLADGSTHEILGESVGGGLINIFGIDGMDVEISGEYFSLITIHSDRAGMAAAITTALADKGVNIAYLRIYREEKGKKAIMVAQTDQPVDQEALERIRGLSGVDKAIPIGPVR